MKAKRIIIGMGLLGILAGVLLSSGCATADGFGKDVEKLGEEIQESVN